MTSLEIWQSTQRTEKQWDLDTRGRTATHRWVIQHRMTISTFTKFYHKTSLHFTNHLRGTVWLWGSQNKLGNWELCCRIQGLAEDPLLVPLPVKWGGEVTCSLVKQVIRVRIVFSKDNSLSVQAKQPTDRASQGPPPSLYQLTVISSDVISPLKIIISTIRWHYHYQHSTKYLSMKEGVPTPVETQKYKTSDKGVHGGHPPDDNSPWISEAPLLFLADQNSFSPTCWLF